MTVSNGLKYTKPVHYVKCTLATIFSEGASSFTFINKSFTSLHELQDVILIFQGHAIHCTNSSPMQTGSLQLECGGGRDGEAEHHDSVAVVCISFAAVPGGALPASISVRASGFKFKSRAKETWLTTHE